MAKDNDILSMYNDIDDMINKIDIKDSDIINDEEDTDNEIIYIDGDELDNIDENITIALDNSEISDIESDNVNSKKDDTVINSEKKLEEIDDIFNKEELVENNDKRNKKLKKEKKKSKKAVIVFGVLDIIAIICLFLMYGPISYFRNLWVTTALATMNHQYLANVFFSKKQIDEIRENNVVIEVDDDTNQDDIDFTGKDPGTYSSIYEEQVLKRTTGNDIYKVIDIEGNGYKGHMLIVYDASRISLVEAPNLKYGGKQLATLVEINNGLAGINASGFAVSNSSYIPSGIIIMNHKLIWGQPDEEAPFGGIIGFTDDNVLVLTRSTAQEAINMGIRDAVSFGPFLIVNGIPAEFKGNGGYGIAPRTAIGQRKDGIVLMLVIDGRRPGHSLGVDMVELTNILLNYGAYNASNLDGGGSSSIVVDGEVLSIAGGFGYTGERYLPNAWIVK